MLGQIEFYLLHLSAYFLISLPFVLIFRFLRVKALKKRGMVTTARHEILLVLFICYTIGLYGLTTGYVEIGGEIRYNLLPFRLIYDIFFGCYVNGAKLAIINIVANILMFAPIGFFSALLWRKPSLLKSAAVTASLSLFIELAQLLMPTRVTDVDDFIMNTIGGALGYAVYIVCVRLLPKAADAFHTPI